MYQSIIKLGVVLMVVLAVASRCPAQSAADKEQAAKLVKVIQSATASQAEKADACRQLQRCAGPEAVAPLAALLGDEKLSHMARYALETIPDASVDVALRNALSTVQGRPLLGVIGSIGKRKDPQAIDALAKLIPVKGVGCTAAVAIGNVGTPAAAAVLESALEKAPCPGVYDGLLRCAEGLAAAGQKDGALRIYDRMRGMQQLPQRVRGAAVRGALVTRCKEGQALLAEYLRGSDYAMFQAAVRATMDMPCPETGKTLAAELPQLSVDKQVVVMNAIALRRDAATLPAILAATKSHEKAVRTAAIRALPMIGDGSAVPVLVALMSDADKEIAQLAQNGFAGIPGAEADAVVVKMLADGKVETRLAAIELIGRRRMSACVPALLKAAGETDAKVRSAAMSKVGELASINELPTLLEMLLKADAADAGAIGSALTGVCQRANSDDACAVKLAAVLPKANPAQQSALIEVLGSVGGGEALKTLRGVIANTGADAAVRATAIRTLGTWKTTDASADLLALAKNSAISTEKLLGLRSFLVMASRNDLPVDQRLAMCREARPVIQRPEERRMLLSALANIRSDDALGLIMQYVEDASTREEACAATLSFAEKSVRGRNGKATKKLVECIEQVSKTTKNKALANRANTLLKDAKAKLAK